MTSIAGGYCDGYPAREAYIAPVRVATDPAGGLWWTDDDGSPINQTGAGPGHDRGSLLVRQVDDEGRVRTKWPVLDPAEGRRYRQEENSYSLTTLVPDGGGGSYVNINVNEGLFAGGANDVPTVSSIERVRADGSRERVVGGLPPVPLQLRPPGPPPLVGYPVRSARLDVVDSYTVDENGNVYLVEALPGHPGAAALDFANLGTQPVVFYAGTPQQVVVPPGRVMAIAGGAMAGVFPAALPTADGNAPATSIQLGWVPRIVLRNGLLYVWDLHHERSSNAGRASAQVQVINLGLVGGTSQTVAGHRVAPGSVIRVAGSDLGPSGYAGDGGPSTGARFAVNITSFTGDLAVGADGSIYIADSLNNRIRRIDNDGLISTVAGTGLEGVAVDGQLAREGPLRVPIGLTVDNRDRVVIAESRGNRILALERPASSAPVLRVLAGRGPTPCGDGQLATGTTYNGGAYFGHLVDVAVDSKGNRFVADGSFNQVRRIRPDGRIDLVIGRASPCGYSGSIPFSDPYPFRSPCPDVGPQGGDGQAPELASLANPAALLVDAYDNLYISDSDRVRYVNLGTRPVTVQGTTVGANQIQTIAGLVFPARGVRVTAPFLGWSAEYTMPLGDLAIDAKGNLFVADALTRAVYRMDFCGVLTVVAGAPGAVLLGDGGPAAAAALTPRGLAYERAKDLLLIDDVPSPSERSSGSRLRMVNLAAEERTAYGVTVAPGRIETFVGTAGADCQRFCSFGDGSSGLQAGISGPTGLALDPDGRLYFVDSLWQRLRVVLPDGRVGGLGAPWSENRSATFYEPAETPVGTRGDGGPALAAWFGSRDMDQGRSQPGLAVTPTGDLLVTGTGGRVRSVRDAARAPLRLGPAPELAQGAGEGFTAPLLMTERATETGAGDLPLRHPDLVLAGGQLAVMGSRGPSSGCHLWLVESDASGQRASYRGQVGTGAAAGAVGSRCVGAQASPDAGLPLPAAGGGAAGALAVAAPRRSDPLTGSSLEAGLLTAVTRDGGGSWRSDPTSLAGERLLGSGLGTVSIGRIAGVLTVAALSRSGGVVVATSADGASYTVESRIPAQAQALGTLTQAKGGAAVLAMVSSQDVGGVAQSFVSVAMQTPEGAWVTAPVASVDHGYSGTAESSAPSLAVDAAGIAYVTWSDTGTVFLSSSRDLRRWSAPTRVSQLGPGVLPSVVAGDEGRVAVAFYSTLTPRTTALDPQAAWYVAVAQSQSAHTSTPGFAVRLATAAPVHRGALCVTGDCTELSPAGVISGESRSDIGAPRVRMDDSGTVLVAFAAQPNTVGRHASGLGLVRSCTTPLLVSGRSPAGCARAAAGSGEVPPSSSSAAAASPVEVRPPLRCDSAPPPFGRGPGGPAPSAHSETRQPVAQRVPLLPPLVVPPLVPQPPGQAALPPGQAPASAQQPGQAQQPGSATQPGTQVGLGVADDEQAQVARGFAADRSRTPGLPPAAWAWLMTGATLTAVLAARRRGQPAPVRLHR